MKKVLITGGNGDIAKAIAKVLLAEGAFEVYLPGKEELDVTNYEQIHSVLSSFKPDILINNAGYVVPYDIKDNMHESEKKSIEINLLGTFWCTSVALSINPTCEIINIGSSAGTRVHAQWSSYCASKAAVLMASKCWAAEGVKVKCLSPGRTSTKMRSFLFPDEDTSTLLNPDDFAIIVLKAIQGAYAYGENIDVNISNIEELKHGK